VKDEVSFSLSSDGEHVPKGKSKSKPKSSGKSRKAGKAAKARKTPMPVSTKLWKKAFRRVTRHPSPATPEDGK
jgi:hypothetical protein